MQYKTLAIVKYLVELVGFSRADFSLFPLEASAVLLRNNLCGLRISSPSGEKLQVNHFRWGKPRFGRAAHQKQSSCWVCLPPQPLVRFLGRSPSGSVPVGLLGGRQHGGGMKRLRGSTCGSHLEEAGRAQVRAVGPAVRSTRTSSGRGAKQQRCARRAKGRFDFPTLALRLFVFCFLRRQFAQSTVTAGFFFFL